MKPTEWAVEDEMAITVELRLMFDTVAEVEAAMHAALAERFPDLTAPEGMLAVTAMLTGILRSGRKRGFLSAEDATDWIERITMTLNLAVFGPESPRGECLCEPLTLYKRACQKQTAQQVAEKLNEQAHDRITVLLQSAHRHHWLKAR